MNALKKLYAQIEKTEDVGDGTLKVWGYASTAGVDSDGETITANAMKAALPDYMKFGAVREMHQSKAAGTAIEASVQDDGRTYFGALIVDSEAVKKVNAGVYKGFSVGGKVTARDELNKTIITGLNLIEVSLVDRPANPEAVFTMYKSDSLEKAGEPDAQAVTAVEELAKMLDDGSVTPQTLVRLSKTTSIKTDELKKFLGEEAWDARRAIDALNTVFDLLYTEMGTEGDPAQVASLNAAIAGLKAFIVAEIQEDSTSKLAKAGAKFSKQTKDALGAVHKAAQEACKHLDGLNYASDEGEGTDDMGKAASADDLAKATSELTLSKAELAKASDELGKAAKRIKELEAMPTLAKAMLRAHSKDGDSQPIEDEATKLAPVTNARGEIDEAATLVKAAWAGKA